MVVSIPLPLVVLLTYILTVLVQALPTLTYYPRIPLSSFFQCPKLLQSKEKVAVISSSSVGYFGALARLYGLANNGNAWEDWVVENLTESHPSSINEESRNAGESDTIPFGGLYVRFNNGVISSKLLHILPASSGRFSLDESADLSVKSNHDETQSDVRRIYLHSRPNGWGTGVHPTTRLCLEWLLQVFATEFPSEEGYSEGNELSLLDYGCGSGILSLAALKLGRVQKVICVDIEAEALVTADANFKLNGYQNDNNGRSYYELFHTRQVEPYCFSSGGGTGVDVCVANILIGQLVRSSMVSALMTNIRPNGLICFSGIRPSEVEALKSAYEPYLEWLDHQFYAELDAQETEGSIESYGFDVGRWSRVVGKVKPGRIDVRDMSEMAIM